MRSPAQSNTLTVSFISHTVKYTYRVLHFLAESLLVGFGHIEAQEVVLLVPSPVSECTCVQGGGLEDKGT